MENRGVQLLGHIRHGSCRPRAILFKVLANTVDIDCKLGVGIPNEEYHEYDDSSKHMSVVVMLKSVEFLVDLMCFPGQLMLCDPEECISNLNQSLRAIPNNNICLNVLSKLVEMLPPFVKQWHFLISFFTSSSHSEPNMANAFYGRSWRKRNIKELLAQSSYFDLFLFAHPEHPLFRTCGRSMLGDRQYGIWCSCIKVPQSMSITPEIGDDTVRAVRAMSESMRQNCLSSGHNDDNPGHSNSRKNELVADFDDNELPAREPDEEEGLRRQVSNQMAVSLPSLPHQLRSHGSDLTGSAEFLTAADLMSTWNRVLQSSPFLNKPLLRYEECHIEFSEITVGTRVGRGSFGVVFSGIWNGTNVAIKLFLEQDLTAENMEDYCNEISILSRLRHPNVILFLGACMKPPNLSVITEYMEMGSLYYLIHRSGQKGKFSWRRRLKMLRDICRGLMCMHRLKIVHRDLKSANCLVNKHWVVKLCDFGLSRVMSSSAMNDNSSAGTPEWMAPELICNEPFTEKCDIFSFGVIMWELCTLSRPWEGIPSVQVVYSVANEGARLEIPDGPLGSLISDCWAEPEKRPCCQEIMTRLADCQYT
ncbi:hypothetical protein ABZP36_031552 [Zizania latifolia]